MADVDMCIFCGNSLVEGAVIEVKKRGLETILKCSERRKDGKKALLQNIERVECHTKCWKIYTNEKKVSAAERNTSRSNPAPIHEPTDATPQVSEAFDFEHHCFFCGEMISEDFQESQKKKSVDKRIVISTVMSAHSKKSIVEAAEKYPNDWSTQV